MLYRQGSLREAVVELLPCALTWCWILVLFEGVDAEGVGGRRRLVSATATGVSSTGHRVSAAAIAVGVGGALALAAASISVFVWNIRARRGRAAGKDGKGKSLDAQLPESMAQYSSGGTEDVTALSLTFNEIQVATDNFSPKLLLSESGHGSVHLGEGPNGEAWAVKRTSRRAVQAEHLFQSEVEFLARISHDNICPLVAYCSEGMEQILVFEYMPNGSLASWLRPPAEEEKEPLSFVARLDIALGVADALRYLHSFSQPTVIHRDVKAGSILLDGEFKARLGGLGLLKHLPGEGLRLRMANKKGYLDPEYFQTFKVTTKCDVYSFGVVMLELLTGCAPIIQVARSRFHRPTTLAQWALQAVEEGKVMEILDPRMPREPEEAASSAVVVGFAKVAASCVAPLRKDRPDMAKVAVMLGELRKGASPTAQASASSLGFNLFAGIASGQNKVVPVTAPE